MASTLDCAVSVRLCLRSSEGVIASAPDRTGCSWSLLDRVDLLACCLSTFFLLTLSLEATAGDSSRASALLSSCSRSRLREYCSIMFLLNSTINLSKTLYRALQFVHFGKPEPVRSHQLQLCGFGLEHELAFLQICAPESIILALVPSLLPCKLRFKL